MNILSRVFHHVAAPFSRPMTPCMKALHDEMTRKAIREIQPLEFSLRASNASPKQTFLVCQFYRDQRAAGVDHGLALWRARQRITSSDGGGSFKRVRGVA